MQILVIGATGNIGQETVKQLVESGIKPRVGVRDIEAARSKLGPQPTYVQFDFQDISTFKPALEGIDRLFFIAPHSDPVPSVLALLRMANVENVKQVIFSSGRTTGDIAGKPLNKVELLIQSHNIPWTIIRPGWFMQNFTSWLGTTIKEEDRLYLPAGKSKTAFIDVRDIGAVLVKILTGTGHEEKMYNLTSDEAIDHHEVVKLISEASNRTISYIPQEREEFVHTMVEKGWPEATAKYTLALYDIVCTGKEEEISPDVEHILGRKPIRFAQFVEDYKMAWQ